MRNDEDALFKKLCDIAAEHGFGGEAECRIVVRQFGNIEGFRSACLELVKSGTPRFTAIKTVFMATLDNYREEIRQLAELKGLKRNAVSRITRLPISEQRDALDKCEPRGVRHVERIRLRILNSKEANKAFTDKLSFVHRAILSALCCAADEGIKSISVSDLWKIMNQDRRWDGYAGKTAFCETVENAVLCLDSLLREQEHDHEWIVAMDGGKVVLRRIPLMWDDVHKIAIPPDMLGGRSRLDWLAKLYVAFCVVRSKKHERMNESILRGTMTHDLGREVPDTLVRSYMSWLREHGHVASFRLGGTSINWTFANAKGN